MRSMGRLRRDASPVRMEKNCCPANIPVNKRSPVPEFPQSNGSAGSLSPHKPFPETWTLSGSTSIGTSKNDIDSSTIATTKTLPVRIIGFVDGPDKSVGDTYTDVLCKFNSGGDATGDSCASHQYQDTTGI